MGTWGTAISANDTYADIYSEFFDLYNEGLEVDEISKKLIACNQETLSDETDSNNFWFALAKAKWECKELDTDLLERIEEIIKTEADIIVWEKLDGDEKDVEKRKEVLRRFLLKLQTEKPKARLRKKKIIRQPAFEKGECFSFKLENGNYGGAVVLEAVYNTELGLNLIATTRINQVDKPERKDFEKAEILLLNYGRLANNSNLYWYFAQGHKKYEYLIERVGKIDVHKTYDYKNYEFGFMGAFDLWIIGPANKQFESERIKAKPKEKQTVKALTKDPKWKLW